MNNVSKAKMSLRFESTETTTATARHSLEERIKNSTGRGSVANVSTTGFGLRVDVWSVCPSSLVKLPDV